MRSTGQEVICRVSTEPAGCTGGNAFHFETWHGVTHCIWHEFNWNNPQKIQSKCKNTKKIRSKWNNIDIISIRSYPAPDRPKIDPSKCQPGPKQVSARTPWFPQDLSNPLRKNIRSSLLTNLNQRIAIPFTIVTKKSIFGKIWADHAYRSKKILRSL